jgi:adenylosuccinate synthase
MPASMETMASMPEAGKGIFVVGLAYGDEGKGKVVQHKVTRLNQPRNPKLRKRVMRAKGGSNAGHTVVLENGTPFDLHQIPCGIVNPDTRNLIGPGVFLDTTRLKGEIEKLNSKGVEVTPENLAVSGLASLVLPHHLLEDAAREKGSGAQGSTKAGIAFVARDIALRTDLRAEAIKEGNEDLLYRSAYDNIVNSPLLDVGKSEAYSLARDYVGTSMNFEPFITDTVAEMYDYSNQGGVFVMEGVQGFGLDLKYGKHPFVTSSSTTVAGLLEGSGLNHSHVGWVTGVAKAFPSKVGGGPFVAEITDEEILNALRGEPGAPDYEAGVTTGRMRQLGWFDGVMTNRAIQQNNVDGLAITKFDKITKLAELGAKYGFVVSYVLPNGSNTDTFPSSAEVLYGSEPQFEWFEPWEGDISGVRSYRNLPKAGKKIIEFTEDYFGKPVEIIGTGPRADQIIVRN